MILPSLYKKSKTNQPKNKTKTKTTTTKKKQKTIGTFLPKCLHGCCGRNRSRDLTYGRRVCQYVDIRKHNTLTKARFIRRSLHEPNLIFGSAHESVRMDRFVFKSTRRSIRLRQSNRTTKVRLRFRCRTFTQRLPR